MLSGSRSQYKANREVQTTCEGVKQIGFLDHLFCSRNHSSFAKKVVGCQTNLIVRRSVRDSTVFISTKARRLCSDRGCQKFYQPRFKTCFGEEAKKNTNAKTTQQRRQKNTAGGAA